MSRAASCALTCRPRCPQRFSCPPSRSRFRDVCCKPFLLEKAVYEVGYEMNNRPDWLAIPTRGIFQVLGPAESTVTAP